MAQIRSDDVGCPISGFVGLFSEINDIVLYIIIRVFIDNVNEFGSMTARRSNKIRKVKTTKRFKLRYFIIQIFKTCKEKDQT